MHRSIRVLGGLASAAIVTAAWGIGGEGLVAEMGDGSWARWQGRLALATATPSWQPNLGGEVSSGLKVHSVSLLGDYYFSGPLIGAADGGGFRATSGLIHGPRSPLAGGTAAYSPGGGLFAVEHRAAAAEPERDAAHDHATLPYLGIGYTGLSRKSGWSFNADLGLVAMYPGHVVKFGRVVQGSQQFEDVLRDMRLAPLMQFAVSYSF